jgi:hypothetical protein
MRSFPPVVVMLVTCIIWHTTWALSSLPNKVQKEIGSITLGVITSLAPFHAVAVPSDIVKIEVDAPKVIEIAKSNRDATLELIKQASGAVTISKPSNLLNFVRDAAAGDILAEINGSPIDVSFMVKKGVADLAINTEVGDISLTFASPLIPNIPLLEKRIPAVTSGAPKEPPKSTQLISDDKIPSTTAMQSFWDRDFVNGYSYKQVAGWGTLGLGAIYGVSYAYYEQSLAEEEAKSAEKKKAAAEKAKKDSEKKTKAAVDEPRKEILPKKSSFVSGSSSVSTSANSKNDQVQLAISKSDIEEEPTLKSMNNQTALASDASEKVIVDTSPLPDVAAYSILKNASASEEKQLDSQSKRRKRRFWQVWKRR